MWPASRLSLALALTLMPVALFALDYDEMVARAMDRDPTLTILHRRQEAIMIGVGLARRPAPLSLSTGFFDGTAGAPGATGSWYFEPDPEDPELETTITPALRLVLPGNTETAIGVDTPLTVTVYSSGASLALSPGLSIEQPLNALFEPDVNELELLQDERSLRDARVAIWERSLAVRRNVAQSIRGIAQSVRVRAGLLRQITTRDTDLARQRVLESSADRNPDYQKLLLAQEIAHLDAQILDERIEYQRLRLAEATGVSPADLASEPFVELPIPELRLPVIAEALPRNPDVRSAESYLVASTMVLDQEVRGDEPSWLADASYGFTLDSSSGLHGHELAAGLTGSIENILISARASASLDRAIEFSFGFVWSLPDGEARAAALAMLEGDVEVAAISAEQARLGFEQAIIELQFRIRELEIRAHELERKSDILAREREVTGRAVEAGVSDPEVLQTLEWQLEDLAFDNYDLLLDRVLISIDIEQLAAPPDVIE